MTKMVFAVSDALTTHGLTTFLVLGVLGVGCWLALRRAGVREAVERWKARAPVIGPVVRGYATARFCQLLGTMLGNSVPLLAALQIARDGAGNLLMERAIDAAAEEVRAGRALAPPLGESGLFDDDVVEMIAVGEAANNLDEVLVKAGESLEGRLDRMIGVAIRLVEPLLLLVIAVVIGIVAMALLIPMSRLGSSL
jgi:general secretion pathway protein F/type IV pilus assembly protein PilC